MKKIFKIGVIILTSAVSINFSSCSNDEPQGGISNNEKRNPKLCITEIKELYDKWEYIDKYEYDDQYRPIKYYNYHGDLRCSWRYMNDSIGVKYIYIDDEVVIPINKEGNFKNSILGAELEYENGKLNRSRIVWDGDNINEIKPYCTYKYSEIVNNMSIDLNVYNDWGFHDCLIDDDGSDMLSIIGRTGSRTKYLISEVYDSDDKVTTKYEYNIDDENGRVLSYKRTQINENGETYISDYIISYLE